MSTAGEREHVMRFILLETIYNWISKSHATFPEHDHHCPAGGSRPDVSCTCGYSAARIAMDALDKLDAPG